MTLINRVAEVWKTQASELELQSSELVEKIKDTLKKQIASSQSVVSPQKGSVLQSNYEYLKRSFDAKNGGFAATPKFPRPVLIQCLFYYHSMNPGTTDSKQALEMALFTLVCDG